MSPGVPQRQSGTIRAMASLERAYRVVVAFLVFGSGCAEDEGLDAEDAWAGRAAEAMCAAVFDSGCGCMPAFVESKAGCEQSRHETMRSNQLAAIAEGDVFDAACADEHLDAIESADCQPIAEFVEAETAPLCQIYSGKKRSTNPALPTTPRSSAAPLRSGSG